MKKFTFKEFLLPGIVLFVICVVTTFLLACTNKLTVPKIEAINAQNEVEAQKKVLGSAESFGEALELEFEGTAYRYFEGKDGSGNIAGYIFITSANGYGGEIRVMTGVDTDGKVAGMEILQLNETPGLGMKAAEEGFIEQFFGKGGQIGVDKNAAGENSVKALTGATITTSAVTDAVNTALELFQTIQVKEG
ncbi:MAG: RnfABCDGE type electron transport complex subunit G [Acutalibacteraceae bacterium]|jgi:electron transport complex protein RnfG